MQELKVQISRNIAFHTDLESGDFSFAQLTTKYGYTRSQIDSFRWHTGMGKAMVPRMINNDCFVADIRTTTFSNAQLTAKYGYNCQQISRFRSIYHITRSIQSPINEQFFRDRDANFYYFLGWVASDGSISDANSICLALKSTDVGILRSIKDMIGLKHQVKTLRCFSKQTQKYHDKCSITFMSKFVADVLAEYQIGPRKSLTLIYPPNIPREMTRHFIRGVFEGDGCIFENVKERLYNVSFDCGSKIFLERLSATIHEHIGIEERPVTQGHGCLVVRWSQQLQVRQLLDWMYEGTDENNRLSRKYDKYQAFCLDNPTPGVRRKRRSKKELEAAGYVSRNKKRKTKV